MNSSDKYPGLTELVFTGRNKDYGSYYLRKKYLKYLVISLLTGIFLFLIMVFIPYYFYYFQGTKLSDDLAILYSVEYDFIKSPDENLPALPGPSKIEPETPEVPVVADTIPEKKKDKEKVETEEKSDQENSDSTRSESNKSASGSGTGDDTGIYTTIDVFPKFPDGENARLAFLRNHIRYPEGAQKSGLQGVVMVVFVIETDGSLSDVKITRGIGAGCDEEAIRVVKMMPRWEPGKRSGKAVRVMVRMPIVFTLPGRK